MTSRRQKKLTRIAEGLFVTQNMFFFVLELNRML